MFLKLAHAVMLVIACMAVGWLLMFLSTLAGDPSGGLELVAQVGGFVAYAAFALLFVLLIVTALAALVVLLQSGLKHALRLIRVR